MGLGLNINGLGKMGGGDSGVNVMCHIVANYVIVITMEAVVSQCKRSYEGLLDSCVEFCMI